MIVENALVSREFMLVTSDRTSSMYICYDRGSYFLTRSITPEVKRWTSIEALQKDLSDIHKWFKSRGMIDTHRQPEVQELVTRRSHVKFTSEFIDTYSWLGITKA